MPARSRTIERWAAGLPPWLRAPLSLDGELADAIGAGLRGDHADLVNVRRHSLPTFIIIGAPKAATTTLTTILPRHPQFFISTPKEPKFFGRRYHKGWRWYSNMFHDGRFKPFRGEASTMYSSPNKSYQYTAALMHKYLPELKLIYIVRDPLDRIESQWRHMKGWDPKTSDFGDLLRAPHGQRQLTIGCSLYFQNLQRFRAFFPDRQIHCMSFEDLLASPEQTLASMLRFLGAVPNVKPLLEDGKLPRVNVAGDKGRALIPKPQWPEELRRRVLQQIRPDALRMLAHMDKPASHWQL